MSHFKLHTLATAPIAALPLLEAAQQGLGFIPNLYAQFAEAPTTLQAYKQLSALLEESSLTPEEQQVVLITVSVENRCEYCVAAHSFIARNMVKVSGDIIAALRAAQPLANNKLNILSQFAQAVVRERGWVADSQLLKDFFAAGYTAQHALEVVLGVTMKTLSNYTNHLADIPLDVAFAGEVWQAPSANPSCNHH
ncbi:MAG: carboxymuconolactone decarboxylase family protein [Gallionella sp.]|nr:carboxymuconolactone decarboxylase family protein [Gallionella sp.]